MLIETIRRICVCEVLHATQALHHAHLVLVFSPFIMYYYTLSVYIIIFYFTVESKS